jgi:5-methylcytosine-specific restriction protein B
MPPHKTGPVPTPYTPADALAGSFVSADEFRDMLAALARKMNLILQGPPGVGKTFLARRLAFARAGTADPARVAGVQFHQSYAYEDFVQGYRPAEGGGFARRDGVFFEFCRRAADDPRHDYVFLIDEINRGNLSKVFGELFVLIEADKRGEAFAVPLTYARHAGETFFVPANLYLIGMMNTADRSLALVDYALRRRFAFADLRPAFDRPEFRTFLAAAGVGPDVIDRIVTRMTRLNAVIRSETGSLGPGFEVGHSFFCPAGTEERLGFDWYRAVVESEIAPLLREYWFDDPARAAELTAELLR